MNVEDLKRANDLNGKIRHLEHILCSIRGRSNPFGIYKEVYGSNVGNNGLRYECEQIKDEDITIGVICLIEKQLGRYKKEFSEI